MSACSGRASAVVSQAGLVVLLQIRAQNLLAVHGGHHVREGGRWHPTTGSQGLPKGSSSKERTANEEACGEIRDLICNLVSPGNKSPRQSRINPKAGHGDSNFDTDRHLPSGSPRRRQGRCENRGYLGRLTEPAGRRNFHAGGAQGAVDHHPDLFLGQGAVNALAMTKQGRRPSLPAPVGSLGEARTWVSSCLARQASSLAASSLPSVASWRAMRSSAAKLLACPGSRR
jgi:hypothetical protein